MSAVGVAVKGVDDLFVVRAGQEHVRAFTDDWVSYFLGRKALEPTWKWRLFPWDKIIPGLPTFAAIDANAKLEGLLALMKLNDAIKVSFLATAPWNHGPRRLRKGVGPALLRFAIGVSKHFQFNGALVLSSTPESETFYEQKGFVRTGDRDEEELAIFRLPVEAVEQFVKAHAGLQPWPEEADSGDEEQKEEGQQ